ncbi:hypothetical protein DXG03_001822 [Asterophora parasitica]|uniref:Uncharacterized protein n=1 Tax=Asterophora parasitica TaxID=117018 RepID=A0A9P7KBD5_9AGAR|nr:hypothetical protein DXG03_001822 [Asterophora parasitica]
MLARSKTAALNVVVGRSERVTQRTPFDYDHITRHQSRLAFAVKTAVLELSRIKNLHISRGNLALADSSYKEIIELLDAPAPLLETVEIVDANLPVNLFAGVSPVLTGLVLSACSFNMQLPIAANLRTLKLCNAPAESKVPVDQFISALSTMTRLEVLHVIDSLDHHHDDEDDTVRRHDDGVTVQSPPVLRVAKLPELTELSIDTLLTNCIFFLDHIVSPTFTRVSVKYRMDLAGMDDMDDDISVVRGFAEKFGPRVRGPIRSMKLHKNSIKVWRSLHTSSSSRPASPPDLEVSLPVLSTYEPAAECFIRSLDLTHMESLIFDCPFSLDLLKTYFSDLIHLTTVQIAGKYAIVLLSALAVGLPRSRSATGAGPSKLKFLTLETLGIRGWDFEEAPTVFHMLKSCLMGRKRAGTPLSILIMDDCVVDANEDLHVDQLRAAVLRKLVWNGLHIRALSIDSDDE